jgi:hypothetical protein
MDPVVQLVWNREDGPAPRPVEMAMIHSATAPFADGAIPYSEGNTDDVSKFVWSIRGWDPSVSGEQAAAEYARLYFGGLVADDAAALILAIEGALGAPLLGGTQLPGSAAMLGSAPIPGRVVTPGSAAIDRLRPLVEACERRDSTLADNWRWLSLRIGALMLDYLARVARRDRDLAAILRYRVAVFRDQPDPREGLAGAISYLERRLAETQALLDEILWTRDQLFSIHRLAIRGVARLQASYMRFDLCLARWRSVLTRLEAGELTDFQTRREAILVPLQEAEDSARLAGVGLQLVAPIREFEWETGPTSW